MNITLKQTDHTGDSAVFEVPEGFEAVVDGDKVILKLKPKKDLRWWWDEYRFKSKETIAAHKSEAGTPFMTNTPNIMPWYITMDFYRWLAEQMNEGGDMRQNWETIAYGIKGSGWVVQYWTDCHYSPVSHAPGTAQQVIDILGEDLLKKIFQIQIV